METHLLNAVRNAAINTIALRIGFLIIAILTIVLIIYASPHAGFLNGEFLLIPIFSCIASIVYAFLFHRKFIDLLISVTIVYFMIFFLDTYLLE